MAASQWEYLMGWGHILFAQLPNRGLIEAHLFGQFCHAGIALPGCALCLFSIAKNLKLPKYAALLFTLIGVSSATLWPYTWIAKNDVGAIYWTLTSIYFLTCQNLSIKKRYFLIGTFAGLAIAAKFNSTLVIVPLILLWMVVPHMLRHSCGFYLANQGDDLRLIQDYLGHRDPKHTALYTRVAAVRFEGLWGR